MTTTASMYIIWCRIISLKADSLIAHCFFSRSGEEMLTPKGSRLLTRMDEQPVEEK
jgi:hypothetical protein